MLASYSPSRLKRYRQKGFTLIELATVLAITGILVLLGIPQQKTMQQVTQFAVIQDDLLTAMNHAGVVALFEPATLQSWQTVDAASLQTPATEDRLVGIHGLVTAVPVGNYYVIPPAYVQNEMDSDLPGTFYINDNGEVWYVSASPVRMLKLPASKSVSTAKNDPLSSETH